MRARGSDIKLGETILQEGQTLKAGEIGLLASIGRLSVQVYTQPKVGIISTGDELVPAYTPEI